MGNYCAKLERTTSNIPKVKNKASFIWNKLDFDFGSKSLPGTCISKLRNDPLIENLQLLLYIKFKQIPITSKFEIPTFQPSTTS